MTDKQAATLQFFKVYYSKYQRYPTFADVARAERITPCAARKRCLQLVRDGYLRHARPHGWGYLELVDTQGQN